VVAISYSLQSIDYGQTKKKETNMSKNLTRQGLALVSGAALVLTSLVGIAAPANAAGEVTLDPTTGTGTSAFTTDPISLTPTVQAAVVATNKLAYRIDNPDQHQLFVSFLNTSVEATTGKALGITETGAKVELGGFTDGAIIDFTDAGGSAGIESIIFYDISTHAETPSISIKMDAKATVAGFVDGTSGTVELVYGAKTTDSKISVQSWVEVSASSDYSTVDLSYSSDKLDVTFIDPKNVSVISEIVRSRATGMVEGDLRPVRLHVTTNVTIGSSNTDAGAVIQGVRLVAGDRILFSGQSTAAEDGIYIVQAGGSTALRSTLTADAAAITVAKISVMEGVDAGESFSLAKLADSTSAGHSGVVATNITAQVNNLNQVGDKYLTANLRFSRADINLNQAVLTNWFYGLESSGAGDLALAGIVLRGTDVATWAVASHTIEKITPSGYSSSNYGPYGSILIRAGVAADALVTNLQYQLKFRHSTSSASVFQSTAFTTVQSPAATAVKVTSLNTSTTDALAGGGTSELRAGSKAFTYRAQARTTTASIDAKFANVPMVAIVQAGAFMPAGESITVTGSSKAITRAGASVAVSGLTDADGRYSVTVSSTTATANQSYTVSFFIANGGTLGEFVAAEAGMVATYKAAAPTTAKVTPEIVSSKDVTLKVAVTDQFGQAVSTNSRGALNVELKAPDKTKLEKFAAVTNGEASFEFVNYLTTGQSEVLTARVFTGSSTSPTYLTALDKTVSMFAPVAVSAVNVPAEVTGVVVNYVDFITGKTSTAKPGPTSGTSYTGTVVNANGAGIAGAGVTIAGTGFQFKSGTSFTVDSVTVTTDAAGTFTVEMWTTVASAAGNKLTVTAGDKTVSTLIKSALPSTTSTKNLVFGWDLPAVILSNTTYAITAKVTDKFGNGVPSASVTFNGFGAAQFNGLFTTTRTTDRSGNATAFLRSLKDVDGVSAIGVELLGTGFTFAGSEGLAAVYTDVTTTSFDESKWTNVIENTINFLKTAPAADKKVNAGSFKGYVALYALGYEGQRMSAKVGNDWVIVPSIPARTKDLFRAVEFVGAGVEISVRIYIDRVLLATIPLLTK